MTNKNERVEAYWREYAEASGVGDHSYSTWPFGDSPEMANSLLALVVGGDKRATAGLARDYSDAEPIPVPGDHSIILDGAGAPKCILRTTEVTVKPLSAADEAFAFDEDEGGPSRTEGAASRRAPRRSACCRPSRTEGAASRRAPRRSACCSPPPTWRT